MDRLREVNLERLCARERCGGGRGGQVVVVVELARAGWDLSSGVGDLR